jgi:hypothetical protein
MKISGNRWELERLQDGRVVLRFIDDLKESLGDITCPARLDMAFTFAASHGPGAGPIGEQLISQLSESLLGLRMEMRETLERAAISKVMIPPREP